jgi:hydroxymethylpyrimidine pyrophosphatase-like HAD family hydrolase
MRYHAVACDYDGTLAHGGVVERATWEALERLRRSGRRIVLVTGRRLDDLRAVCPELSIFEAVVAENGAILHRPASDATRRLADPPPARFAEAVRNRGVEPLAVGEVIVATWEPHQATVLDVIRELGLELQVIFNKGAVMVLPSGVNKATGLGTALDDLGLSLHNAVGIGDAENDHAFLAACECAVAVANALPSLRERVDWVTSGDHGGGVRELAEALLEDDLRRLEPRLARHLVPLGWADGDRLLAVPPYGCNVLIAGTSGGGKSTFARGLLERLHERGYQSCIVDPEGDYADFGGPVVELGTAKRAPSQDELCEMLEHPTVSVAANLLGIPLEDRPPFFERLFPRLEELRARTARPHWIVVDETHHLLPAGWGTASPPGALGELHNMLLVTVHPEHVSREVLGGVDLVIAIGKEPERTLRTFAEALGQPAPAGVPSALESGEGVVWWRREAGRAVRFRSIPPEGERRRHVRKYAEGDLGPDKSFYFRGPDARLNLRAQNLNVFLQVADGVDDETWLHHLRRRDVSRWFRDAIKSAELAEEAARVETDADLPPRASRERIREAVERRFTGAS